MKHALEWLAEIGSAPVSSAVPERRAESPAVPWMVRERRRTVRIARIPAVVLQKNARVNASGRV